MASNFNNDSGTGYVVADGFQIAGAGNRVDQTKVVPLTLVAGAATAQFTLPNGAYVTSASADTPVAIPGTPTNTNLRVGSSANGQQYVADVDVKAQGNVQLTVLYPARNSTGQTYFATIASSGGTAAQQVGTVNLIVKYLAPQPTT